ncbi:MAG: TIGR03663 family protein [Oligoflexia bacterium]|nr:TIGR03663 family protein [Oligoflexia bacterium]
MQKNKGAYLEAVTTSPLATTTTTLEKSWQDYFSKKQWIIFLLLILIGTIMRFASIESRPLHHDEALTSTYGNYALVDPHEKFYHYNPLLHGPLLYDSLSFVFNIFGANNWSGRVMMAFLGTLFIFVPFLFRRFMHPLATICLTTLWSLSPSFIYWSRFIHQDHHIIFAMMLMAYGVLLAPKQYRSLLVILGITLQMCLKLNVYVHLTILLGYLLFEFCHHLITRTQEQTLLKRSWLNLKEHPLMLLLSIAIGAFIYCYSYSAGFLYIKGILDGLYRESFPYWLNQHNIERIKGPFLYHFFSLSWYDFIVVLLFLAHFFHFYIKKSNWISRASMLIAIILSTLLMFAYKNGIVEISFFWSFFKFKNAMDCFGPIIVAVHALNITIYHLNHQQKNLAFWGYMTMAMFFTYGYLGEKVPWLTLYIYLPATLYTLFYFQHYFLHESAGKNFGHYQAFSLRAVLLAVGIFTLLLTQIFYLERDVEYMPNLYYFIGLGAASLLVALYLYLRRQDPRFNLALCSYTVAVLFLLKIAIITNFSRAGSDTEFLCQVHTSATFQDIALTIRQEMISPYRGERPMLLTTGASIWPMTWFMRDLRPFYTFIANKNTDKKNFHYIIEDGYNNDASLKQTHYVQYLPLRHWWVPDYEGMNLFKYLYYAFEHRPWNQPGAMFITFAKRKNF